ncbi:hypothetical protein ACFL2J_08170, partial [Candidatus Omnitrophota bacterium]
MYLRYKVWQDVLHQNVHSEDEWSNEFTIWYPCVDIRFMLKGYGWKTNSGDENIPVLYEGVYKCYYRKQGDTDWIQFARCVAERASSDNSQVYKDVIVSTGLLEEAIYEVKVEAVKAREFESWGGAIEKVVKNQKFYYTLQIRASMPLGLSVVDEAFVGEFAYGGKSLIDFDVNEVFELSDVLIELTRNYQLLAVDIDVVDIVEEVQFFFYSFRSVLDVVLVSEWVNFFSPIINVHSPIDFATVEDYVEFFFDSIGLPTPVENVSITEWVVMAKILLNINVFDFV